MSVLARKICNYKYEYNKTLVLRLYKKSNSMLNINKGWKGTFIIFQKLPEKHIYFPSCQKSTKIAINDNKQTDFIHSKFIPEHQVMFNLMKESIHYTDTIMMPINTKVFVTPEDIEILCSMTWSSKSALDCFKAIKRVTYCYLNNNRINDETKNEILNAFTAKLSALDDQQIKKLMQNLIVINNSLQHLPSYTFFMKELDKECLKRFFSFDPSQMLLIMSAFYQLNLNKSNYMWRTLRKMGSKSHKFSPKVMVQFFFYLSICNVSDLNIYDLEYHLEEHINELIGDDIGIIARGFFMTQRQITNKLLLRNMVTRFTNSVHTMHNSTIGAFMKVLRYSNSSYSYNQLHNLIMQLYSELERLPLVTLTHIAHTCGALRIYNRDFIHTIVCRLLNKIQLARLKDIERIIFLVCALTPHAEYRSECHEIVNELIRTHQSSRLEEIQLHPKSFLRILTFLIQKNIYPEELITHVLNPTFVEKVHKNNMYLLTNELLNMDCSVKIEVPNYTGPFLDEKVYRCLVKKFCKNHDVCNRHPNVQLRTEIIYICKEKLGIYPHIDWILPHYGNADIIFGLDEHDKCIAVESILSVMPHGSIKRVNNNDDLRKIQWKVLILFTNRYEIHGQDDYISFAYTMCRQLKTIGYTPIPIYIKKWEKLNTEDEKSSYLKQLIFHKSNFDFTKV